MKALRNILSIAAGISLFCLSGSVLGQTPFWSQYGGNPQHTAEVTTGVQDMNSILWQTPEDLYPPVDGTDLFIHYGSPLVTNGGTVVVTVRNGPNANFPSTNDTYQIEGHDLGTGTTLWTQTSDYTDWMPHDWIPSFGSAISPDNKVYTPGAGGTIWVRSNADSASATVSQECFYGMSNYTANQAACNANVQIDTPITVDSSGNIYFGFYVTSGWTTGNPVSLANGVAKISSTGVGTWVTADSASGNSGDEVAMNSAPAISNDGSYVYVAVKQTGGYNNPELLRLNTADLSTASSVNLAGPSNTFAYIFDDGTASPMVGPDGDVYFGDWYSDLESRGFMLHYSGDLSTSKPAGAFGWDDTASVVPASAVPSYTGSSSYLILTKYNNYADPGCNGDGLNKVAILDPNATESYTVQYESGTGPTYTVMQEILTVLGPTVNTAEDLPGVREWCINMSAIDVAGKSAVINSEDGHAYHWDFTTNILKQAVNLNPPIGEAYTPTVVGPGGISFAVNDANLYAIWDGVKPSAISSPTITGGNSTTETLTLSAAATGPGASMALTSSNPNVQVPSSVFVAAGSNSVTFNVTSTKVDANQTSTITANRFGFTASGTTTIGGTGLYSVFVNNPQMYGGFVDTGGVELIANAPTSGRTVTLSSNLPSISLPSGPLTVTSGTHEVAFSATANPVSTTQTGTITATLDDGTTITTPITNNVALLYTFTLSPTTITGGGTTTARVTMRYGVPAAGLPISMTYSAHTSGPAIITAESDGVGTGTVSSSAVSAQTVETIAASFDGTTLTSNITLVPFPTLVGFTVSNSSPYMTYAVTGTVTLSSAPTANVSMTAKASDIFSVISTQPSVLAGHTTGTFTITTAILGHPVADNSTITVTYGNVSLTQTLSIQPIFLTSISVSPTTIHAGQTANLIINIGVAPGAYPMSIKTYCASSLLSVPAVVYMPIGQTTLSVPITAAASVTGDNRVPIYVYLSGDQLTTFATVEP